MNPQDINRIVELGDELRANCKKKGKEVPDQMVACRQVMMHILKEGLENNPLQGAMNTSKEVSESIELFISIAIGIGYTVAARDALKIAREHGDQQAKRN